jgi:hydrogenase maturation protease
MTVRVIVLGDEAAGDDGAAVAAARRLDGELFEQVDMIFAGRPGEALSDLLDAATPTLILDVVRGVGAPGTVVELALAALADEALFSAHDGDSQRALARAMARGPLPHGAFIGIEGLAFDRGGLLSPDVERGVEDLVIAARALIHALSSS